MRIQNHSGKSVTTGTFFVYDDEILAKKHVNPTIFSRLEKAKTKQAESQKTEEVAKEEESKAAEASTEQAPAEDVKEEKSE